MPAFAIAHLRDGPLNDDVLEYIDRVQGTLDPFGGRFRVHGATVEILEGQWPGTVVVIEFPDLSQARAWYGSPAYRDILPLRTRHLDADVILVDGVGPDYDAAATSAKLRERVADAQ